MNSQSIQNKIRENSHGLLFGAIAAILTILIRNVEDTTTQFWLVIISMLIGGIVTYYFNIPKKFLSYKMVLLIFALIVTLSLIGEKLDLFSPIDLRKGLGRLLFSKVGGLAVLSGSLFSINLFLGVIALIFGLIVIGIPLGGLISTITKNFTLVLIVVGIVALLAIIMKKR